MSKKMIKYNNQVFGINGEALGFDFEDVNSYATVVLIGGSSKKTITINGIAKAPKYISCVVNDVVNNANSLKSLFVKLSSQRSANIVYFTSSLQTSERFDNLFDYTYDSVNQSVTLSVKSAYQSSLINCFYQNREYLFAFTF